MNFDILPTFTWGAVFVALVCVIALLIHLRGVRDEANRYGRQNPPLAASVRTLSWVSSITLTCIVIMTGAYTVRLMIVRPLIEDYPRSAQLLDLIVYLVMLVGLLMPTWMLIWRKQQLKDADDA